MLLLYQVAVMATDVVVDGICYSLDAYATVIKNDTLVYGKDIVIPDTITYQGKSYAVTSIGDEAFYCTGIKSISLPNTLESIGEAALYGDSLTTITIPNSVSSMGYACLSNNWSLKAIRLPDALTYLGPNAFSDCHSLISVVIPANLTSIGYDPFWACDNIKRITFLSTDLSRVESQSGVFNNMGGFGVMRSSPTVYVNSDLVSSLKTSWSAYTIEPWVPIEEITLNKTEINILRMLTYQLSADVSPSDATDKTYTWSSSDRSVATVDQNGLVTAMKIGTATITATANDGSNAKAACTVTVIPDILVNSIAFDATEVDVLRYDYCQLNATVLPEDANNKTLTWLSSNTSVATVTTEGKVYARKVGTAVITATANDGSGVKASCTVNVKPNLVKQITLNKTEVDVLQTLTYQLTATISPTYAENKSVTWSSSDESVATVDQNGLVTAVKAGTAIITVKANDGSGVKASCTVNVKPVTINLSTKTVSLMENQTYSEQEVSVLPESYEHNYVIWSTSDASVATINSAGTITAVSPGIATITYALDYNSDITAECRVIVYDESVVYVGGLYYILDAATKTATVTSIYGKNGNGLDEDKIAQYYSGTISIPSTVTYDGVTYNVTNVGQYAFVCQNDLQSLYIPASVVNVERYAATSAKNLQLINVADGSQLETISLAAFKDCVGLRYFTFDGTTNQMKSINNYAFYGCSKLQRVKWTGSTTLHTIADYAFYKCTALNNFAMPNTVTSVGNYSFRYDSALKKITLSSALNIINEYAFGECGFSEIVLPESLGSIQAGAFINNSYLTSITIPAKVQGIGSAAFENNAALATVSFKTSISTMTIGDNAFNECPVLNRVNIDHLDSWAQTNFSNVKANPASTAHHLYMNDQEIINAELPAGTKYVNNNAFNGCSSIKSVLLPATTDHINDDIFVGCSSLTDVYCFAEEVPAFIGTGNPDNMSDVFQRATLHVPFGTESDYKADDWWGRFYRIAGFDPAGINVITLDEEDGAAYYQLGGVKLASKPQQEGIYIRVKDGKSQKVVVRKK